MLSIAALRLRTRVGIVQGLIVGCCVALPVRLAGAADLNADAHIDRVTVYRENAIV